MLTGTDWQEGGLVVVVGGLGAEVPLSYLNFTWQYAEDYYELWL